MRLAHSITRSAAIVEVMVTSQVL